MHPPVTSYCRNIRHLNSSLRLLTFPPSVRADFVTLFSELGANQYADLAATSGPITWIFIGYQFRRKSSASSTHPGSTISHLYRVRGLAAKNRTHDCPRANMNKGKSKAETENKGTTKGGSVSHTAHKRSMKRTLESKYEKETTLHENPNKHKPPSWLYPGPLWWQRWWQEQ